MNAEFFKQPMHVGMHRGRADSESRSDFLVLQALKKAGEKVKTETAEATSTTQTETTTKTETRSKTKKRY